MICTTVILRNASIKFEVDPIEQFPRNPQSSSTNQDKRNVKWSVKHNLKFTIPKFWNLNIFIWWYVDIPQN